MGTPNTPVRSHDEEETRPVDFQGPIGEASSDYRMLWHTIECYREKGYSSFQVTVEFDAQTRLHHLTLDLGGKS
jgi:hypothetical protein